MKKLTSATIGVCGLAALAIGLATPALAANDAASIAIAAQSSAATTGAPSSQSGKGTVALPPGGPVASYPQPHSTVERIPTRPLALIRTCPNDGTATAAAGGAS
jgi:hypothetical protein